MPVRLLALILALAIAALPRDPARWPATAVFAADDGGAGDDDDTSDDDPGGDDDDTSDDDGGGEEEDGDGDEEDDRGAAGEAAGGLELPLPPPRPDPDPQASTVLALGLDSAELALLRRQGFRLEQRAELAALGLVVHRLRIPAWLGPDLALVRLRRLLPEREFDLDSRYRLQGTDGDSWPRRLIAWPPVAACTPRLALGLVDTGVAVRHPELRALPLVRRRFASGPPADPRHGTDLARLLVGRRGLLPGARLFAADVFAQGRGGPESDALTIARALDWLLGMEVRVANLALAGPDNLLLREAVRRASRRGLQLVAAAGNGGPAAPPAYPAAYPEVLAATAVDRAGRLWPRAQRGDYIDLAAPGVGLVFAGRDAALRSGTSYAAAFVAAAAALLARGGAAPLAIRTGLRERARDLGPPGRDPLYGWGLLQLGRGCG